MQPYETRRGQIEAYFDRTAVEAWSRLMSDAPVGRVRATVRAGRDRMRSTMLSWLPDNLEGRRVLDAGCGTGMFAIEAARRGAHVVAVDLSPTLVALGRERLPADIDPSRIEFRSGDMLDEATGQFDHVVSMDALIHYPLTEVAPALSRLAARTSGSIVFTFAPRTPILGLMMAAGRMFPRADRSPSILPVREAQLRKEITANATLATWRMGRTQRVSAGFYISQALELNRQ